ncbi:hypothetical protein [Asticcacaulis benevestitus]|uniref:Uncharacterized protein n=1 Tax=Asticcacaulis benevestitus DSM 16100 = ATCC BAA-896 TaxID=1121022 RepID=V4PXY4_9CAUL|nr:hypothetical protein [Asticcacaulis benevestitus]ESQ92279.1 hypothetical protein ABENE_08940 [Asticcacaulis benevestitus DSM 16100 = ATCC BAA-896]
MKTSLNFKKMAQRVQTLVIAVGLACIASVSTNAAYAAPKKEVPAGPFKIDPAVQAKSMTDIPAIIALAKFDCVPSNAYLLGATEFDKAGTKVKGQLYEVACKTGPGFIITSVSPTEVGQAFTCSLAAKLKATQPDAIQCVLPENQPHYAWLNTVVQPYIPGCQVSDARVIGSTSAEPLIDRYEVGCGASAGGILDYPQLGTKSPIEYKSCLTVEGTPSACKFTTKEQLLATLKPLATQASATCQVNNVRFIGVSKENDSYFYEFGCANQPGFVVLTKTDNTYQRMVSCAAAAGLGGCTFTDAGAASKDAGSAFSTQLAKGGFPCTVEEYNVIGTQEQTKRDYIEFKCKEQPWGLIGFVPQAGSTSSLRLNDCFIDQTSRKSCTYVTEPTLRAQLDKLIKIAQPGKGCDVSQVRYIGESDGIEGALLAELACSNKRGYIAIVSADRNKITESVPCTIAKSHKDPIQCEIPGNGTYASAE